MERTSFTEIQGVPVRLVYPDRNNPKQRQYWERGQILIKRGKKIVGFMNRDDLFDADGNYFSYEACGS